MLYEVLENMRATPGKSIIYFVMNCCSCYCTPLNSARSPFWHVWHFYISFPKQLPSIVVIIQKGICKDRSCSFNWQIRIRMGRRSQTDWNRAVRSFMVVLAWWQARSNKIWGENTAFLWWMLLVLLLSFTSENFCLRTLWKPYPSVHLIPLQLFRF